MIAHLADNRTVADKLHRSILQLDPNHPGALARQTKKAADAPGVKAALAASLYADAFAAIPDSPGLRRDLDRATYQLLRGIRWLALICVVAAGSMVDLFAAEGETQRDAGQDVEPADDLRRHRRAVAHRPPHRIRTDGLHRRPRSRHVHKTRSHRQDGFKAHLAVEPETGLITAITLRPAAGAEHHEAAVALDLLDQETGTWDVLADSAYSTAALREELTASGHRLLIKPAVLKKAVTGGFTLDDFHIDAAASTVACPAGHTTTLLPPSGKHQQRKAWFNVQQCTGCPLRARCTTSKRGRVVTWRPHHELQADARRQATDPSWQADYRRWRPPVERVIAWLVAHGNRRLPCRGSIKGERWIHHRAAALNLRRLINLGLNHHNGTWTLTPAIP
ncbi:transposase [Streptomyces sp. P1-3]|uniref:transposase n=1 Tax=Streptomyces sp. P1-3 TaxID=3421658 RepID=UPI003D369587